MYTVYVSARERLVESTRELLWERGYVGTSPKTIQQRAGAGQGSMYHHFAGKEELAQAAIRRTADELRAAADAQLSAPGTAIERISAYLRRERDVPGDGRIYHIEFTASYRGLPACDHHVVVGVPEDRKEEATFSGSFYPSTQPSP